MEKVKNAMWRHLKVPLSIGVVFCLHCVYTIHTNPVLHCEGEFTATKMDKQWREYDAYYLCDEMFIEASYSTLFSGPVNKIIYNKKIKIITDEGTSYGTVAIPKLSENINRFEVELKDAAGATVPLNIEQLKTEYLRKEVVVVPNVTPGCELSVCVAFTAAFMLPAFEYYFSRDIPSVVSTFTFSEYSPYHYEFKSYNIETDATVETVWTKGQQRSYRYHTYQLHNVLPRKTLAFQESIESKEAKVALVLRNAFSKPAIANWNDLTNGFAQTYFRICYTSDEKKLMELTAGIRKKKNTLFDAADSVLRLIQTFHLCDETEECKCNLTTMLESRKGNLWGITALLRKLFMLLGAEVDILVTRARDNGGFDKDFVTTSSLKVPLLVVTINDTPYVAFPFKRGGKLGEYPTVLEGLYALSFTEKQPVLLPPSTAGYSRSALSYQIKVKDDLPQQAVDFTMYGSLAYDTRSLLGSVDLEKQNESFQRWLTQLGTSNAMETCHIYGIDEPGTPLRTHITFSNADQFISRGKTTQIKLSNLFERYFESYDTFRVDDVVISRPIEDSVEIKLIAGKAKIKPVFKCNSCENALFSVKCDQSRKKDTLLLHRIVRIDSARISAEEMKRIYPDILNLNRIGESSVTVIRRK
jgi:hypothetical protein